MKKLNICTDQKRNVNHSIRNTDQKSSLWQTKVPRKRNTRTQTTKGQCPSCRSEKSYNQPSETREVIIDAILDSLSTSQNKHEGWSEQQSLLRYYRSNIQKLTKETFIQIAQRQNRTMKDFVIADHFRVNRVLDTINEQLDLGKRQISYEKIDHMNRSEQKKKSQFQKHGPNLIILARNEDERLERRNQKETNKEQTLRNIGDYVA